jgi:hypothetical protein
VILVISPFTDVVKVWVRFKPLCVLVCSRCVVP